MDNIEDKCDDVVVQYESENVTEPVKGVEGETSMGISVIVLEVGMLFQTEKDLYEFNKTYAYSVGFPVKKRNSKKGNDGVVRFVTLTCSREGGRISNNSGSLEPQPTVKMGCKARISASADSFENWRINTVNLDHNHETSPSKSRLYRCNRKLSVALKRKLQLRSAMSQPPRPAWARFRFMAQAAQNFAPPAPITQPAPTPTPAPPPIQLQQTRAPFGQLARTPAVPSQQSQPREPTPPPSPAATPAPPPPASTPPAPARSPPRSPVTPPPAAAPPAPARSPPRSPVAPPPAAAPPAPARSPARSPVAPPVPIAQPAPPPPTTTPPALPPIQPLQPRAPFRPLARAPTVPSQLSQPREPTPLPPPVAPPAAAPPVRARSPPRSPVAPPVPAPSTPRKSPISAPPTAVPSSKPLAPSPPRETTTSASKSPVINTLPNSPVPKEPLNPTNIRVPSSPIRESPKTERQAPSSSMPASPVPKPVVTAALESSPKTVKPLEKTPVQSPKPKPVAPPPSPFTLPPSQIKPDSERESKIPTKVDQKDVLVQETIEKLPKLMPTNFHSSNIASNGKQEFPKEKVPNKKSSDSEKLGMSVITLAGDNKGAVMELSPSYNKKHSTTNPHSLQKNGNYAKLRSEGEKSSSDEEGRSKREKDKKAMVMPSPPMTAYVNSNVQGVNNSIFFNGSSTNQNPGVHLSINRKENGGHGIHLKDHHA